MVNLKNIWTICCHDFLDQVRDRRTLFMIIILPLVLYPLAGELIVNLAVGKQLRPKKVIVINASEALSSNNFEAKSFFAVPFSSLANSAFCINPFPAIATGLFPYFLLDQIHPPSLFVFENDKLKIAGNYLEGNPGILLNTWEAGSLPKEVMAADSKLEEAAKKMILDGADAVLVFPLGFLDKIKQGLNSPVHLFLNEKDDSNKLMESQIRSLIFNWAAKLRAARFLARGLSTDFHQVITIIDATSGKMEGQSKEGITKEIRGVMKKILPLLLVMWALVGALYPAIDLCAGEKERGTMETLLISAASRYEIVLGKFLAIWTFSTVTALLNIVTMGLTATHLASSYLNIALFNPVILILAFLLLLPLGAFFSAFSLAIGAYARSSREGQYYLMPLVMVTLPLVMITLAPGTKLDLPTCFVPITGIAVLLQELIEGSNYDAQHLLYLVCVLSSTAGYAFLSLQWSVRQFQREDVLFREAEQFHWPTIFKGLKPSRKTLPSIGVAIISYSIILIFVNFSKTFSMQMGCDPSVVAIVPIGLIVFGWMRKPTELISWKTPATSGIVIAILIGLALIPVMTQLSLLEGKTELLKNLFDELVKGNLVEKSKFDIGPVSVVGFLLLPLIVVEVVFFGFILGNIRKTMGMIEGASFVALLYAAHTFQAVRFLPDLVSGFFFALLVLRFNSLWVAIIAHLVSVIPALMAFASLSGLPAMAVDMQLILNAWLLWGLFTGFAVTFLLFSALFLIMPEIFLLKLSGFINRVQSGANSD